MWVIATAYDGLVHLEEFIIVPIKITPCFVCVSKLCCDYIRVTQPAHGNRINRLFVRLHKGVMSKLEMFGSRTQCITLNKFKLFLHIKYFDWYV